MYDFKRQYQEQAKYFDRFVVWYEHKYMPDSLRVATREEERRSIDLVAITGTEIVTIEVKTEFAAATTGNIVFETVSQARIRKNGVLGWGFKLEDTDLIAYVIPGPDKVYIFETDAIQEFVLDNYPRLRNFKAENKDYLTLGVLLPLRWVEKVARVSETL